MIHRIAIASSDGKYIDLHFARASQIYIYDVKDNSYEFVELRKCKSISNYDVNEFDKAILNFHDCLAIFVGKIGKTALLYIISRGLRVFEAPYPIESVLKKLVQEDILDRVYESE